MTDQELLGLAAKAAGHTFEIEATVSMADGRHIRFIKRRYWDDRGRERVVYWDPLSDDGDALRLAVRLGFINPGCWPNPGHELDLLIERGRPDWELATRRAIVKRAADIGMGME
jgi:hypothetical protein